MNEMVLLVLPLNYAKMIQMALTGLDTHGLPVGMARKVRMIEAIGKMKDGQGNAVLINDTGFFITNDVLVSVREGKVLAGAFYGESVAYNELGQEVKE